MSDFGVIANVPRTGSGPRARIFVATPSYDGTLHHTFVTSLLAATLYCLYHKVELELRIVAGACLIQYARNQLVREFLEDATYTHMMWIDADVGFDPRGIMQLLEHGKDAVGGVYPMKCIPLEWPYAPMAGENTTAVHRAQVMPGGFLLVSRRAVQAAADRAPEYWHHLGGLRYATRHVFDLVLEDRTLLGEDVIFTRRLREAGFEVWCDPNLAFSHRGPFEWRGNLARAIECGAVAKQIDHGLMARIGQEHDGLTLAALIGGVHEAWGSAYAPPAAELVALALLAKRSRLILEAGSGISTLVMAAANPQAEIHTLEHDPAWAAKLEAECDALKLANVHVHRCALDASFCYQIPDTLPSGPFDLCFVDGPPFFSVGAGASDMTASRRPLYARIAERIKGAVLVIDDSEHYRDIVAGYERHEVMFDRFAICLPNGPRETFATSTAA